MTKLEAFKIEVDYNTRINEAAKELMTKLEIANYAYQVNGDYEAYALFLEEAAQISRRISILQENQKRFLELHRDAK